MVGGAAERRCSDLSWLRSGAWPRTHREAVAVGLALRFALTAPPFGLRRASLRARPTAKTRTRSRYAKFRNKQEMRYYLKRYSRDNVRNAKDAKLYADRGQRTQGKTGQVTCYKNRTS